MWKWLEQYFTFTKSERQAVIALVILSVIILIAPKVYFFLRPAKIDDSSIYKNELNYFANSYQAQKEKDIAEAPSGSSAENKAVAAISKEDIVKRTVRKTTSQSHYFKFDPNKIGINEWVRLGFTQRQAQVIEHYKAKGGLFYKATDLKRLYVMSDEHYEKLEPYVVIDADALPKRDYGGRNDTD